MITSGLVPSSDDASSASVSQPGEDSLTALGYLQVGAGSLTIAMSLMALCPILLGHGELLDPTKVFGFASGFLDRAIATYVSLQLSVGWIAGTLQLIAGIGCLHGKITRLTAVASVVSLINVPHGAITAVLMLYRMKHASNGLR
jgi:hypothetical protein